MASKENSGIQPGTASTMHDASSTQSRTEYCVDNIKEFSFFFATQSRLWLQDTNTQFSVIEAQVLSEVARYHEVTTVLLSEHLKLNAKHLTCVLDDLYKRGLVSKTSVSDSTQTTQYSLTELGRNKQEASDVEFRNNITKTLGTLSQAKQTCLVDSVNTIKTLLNFTKRTEEPYFLRSHQQGDMGWVVYRHAVLYGQEYGWGQHMEAVTAEIAANFLKKFDPKLDRCIIAERNGEIIGCVILVKATENIAQLRLLLVEPSARGLGIGSRLVDECIQFARNANYHKVILWTQTVLHSALRIYKAAGFKLIKEQAHTQFGKEEIGQTWELEL